MCRQRGLILSNYILFHPAHCLRKWKLIHLEWWEFQSCLQFQKYNGQSVNTRWFLNEIMSFQKTTQSQSTINLILCILPPMCNKGWTAIHHWIWPIKCPFTVVFMEGMVSLRRRAPSPRTTSIYSWPRLAWPRAGWAFVWQTGFGTLRWSSL